jgi:DNA helicase-2/ATP-dependent DNA helicase PcrA
LRGPAVQIVACAGAGKTGVLAKRATAYLLEGVPADGIVAFTFTEKAAEELRNRIDKVAGESDARFRAMPPSAAGLFVGTIHGYCLHLLRDSGLYEVHDVLSEEREWAFAYRFARRLGLFDLMEASLPGRKVSRRAAVETFLRNIAAVYSDDIPTDEVARHAPLFSDAIRRYEDLMDAARLLSFDRMIRLAADLLAPGGALYRGLQGRVREVLVDEYQDLNRAQERLLIRLRGLGANVAVVGDDDQAIYQWRGGDVSLFVRFPDRHGAATKQLGENHRSVPAIVETASSFASTIGERVRKHMSAVRGDGGPAIEVFQARDAADEAAQIVRRIRQLLADGHAPHDIAILFRSVRTSAGPVLDALRAAGIPAALTGRVSLLDRPEMALVARLLVWWSGGTWRPDEREERVTRDVLLSGIGDVAGVTDREAAAILSSLESIGESVKQKGVPDIQSLYMRILRTIGLPSVSLDDRSRSRQEMALGAMSALLVDFEHAIRRKTPPEWSPRSDVHSSEEIADERAIQDAAGAVYLRWLTAFLERHASQAAEERPEGVAPAAGAVNVMTVHQAKGLEFFAVFLPSLVEGRFPSSKAGRPQEWFLPPGFPVELFDRARYEGRLDDERRLFYVALTRATDLLVMSCFKEHERNTARPSQFLRELGAMQCWHLVKKTGECRPAVRAEAEQDDVPTAVDCTGLLLYGECPYKFYLKHVCGFAGPIAPEMGFGRVLHHVVAELARAAKQGRVPAPCEAASMLERSFYLPFAGAAQRDRLFEAARRRVARFVEERAADLARTVDVERRFEVPLDGSRVRGRIDLLLRDAESSDPARVEVVDLKTAESSPPLPQHRNQLRLYARALRASGLEPVRILIYDLESDGAGILPVEDDRAEYAAFEAGVSEWLRGIRRGDFPRRKGKSCAACDYGSLCAR